MSDPVPPRPAVPTTSQKPLNVVLGGSIGLLVGAQFLTVAVEGYFQAAAGAMAALALIALVRVRHFSVIRSIAAVGLCVGPLFISILLNRGGFAEAAPPLALTAFALAAYVIGRHADDADWRLVLRTAGATVAICFVAAMMIYRWDLIGAVRTGTRLNTGMHPNLFGLTAMTGFLIAAWNKRLTYVLGFLVVAAIACLAASARGALLTLVLVLGLSRFILWRQQPIVILSLLVASAALATALLLVAGPWLESTADAVFQINDRYRGLSSGGSGRTRLWGYFLDAWRAQPLFGPGPGTAFEMNGRATYSHNLVLQLLVDSGLVGLGAFVALIIWTVRSVGNVRTPETLRTVATLALFAYFFYGIFEGRAVNIGNPLSAVFFFIVFATLGASDPVRRFYETTSTTKPVTGRVAERRT